MDRWRTRWGTCILEEWFIWREERRNGTGGKKRDLLCIIEEWLMEGVGGERESTGAKMRGEDSFSSR